MIGSRILDMRVIDWYGLERKCGLAFQEQDISNLACLEAAEPRCFERQKAFGVRLGKTKDTQRVGELSVISIASERISILPAFRLQS